MLTFKKLAESDLELVLEWRTMEHVTKYMYNDIEKDIKKQQAWFSTIAQNSKELYWIIKYNDISIGLISLNDIDVQNKRASSGFYIGNMDYSIIAGRILPYFFNFVFLKYGLHKLHIEVMAENKGMVKMDLQYGFRHVGTFNQHIYKYGLYHDVEIFELLASTWEKDYGKYHHLVIDFEL